MQDLGVVFARVLHKVPRSIHVLYLPLQHIDEDLLYFIHSIHYIPHEVQETLLHCKLPLFS
jgi:hypothetical protein